MMNDLKFYSLPQIDLYFIRMKMIKCPDCTQMIERTSIRVHILQCKSYKPNLFENTTKLADHLNCEYLQFLIAEIDMAK